MPETASSLVVVVCAGNADDVENMAIAKTACRIITAPPISSALYPYDSRGKCPKCMATIW
jgi:phosphoribosylcarboxyaminoimidazole (NCAIR) mutase